MKFISEMMLFVQMKNILVIKFWQGTIDLGANNVLISSSVWQLVSR